MDIARSLPVSLFLHTLLVAVALVIGGNGTLANNDLVVTLLEEQEIRRDTSGGPPMPLVQEMKQGPDTKERRVQLSAPRESQGGKEPPWQDLPTISGPEETAAPTPLHGASPESLPPARGSDTGAVFMTAKTGGAPSPSAGGGHISGTDTTDIGAELKKIRMAIEDNLIYPYIAIRRQMEGTVRTEFTINQKGFPEEIRITGSSGFAVLDEAARTTLVKASPFPSVPGRIEIPITFMLKKKEGNR